MAFEGTEIGTSGPAQATESAPAQPDKTPAGPAAQEPGRSGQGGAGRMLSEAELRQKAAKVFEDARKAMAASDAPKADSAKADAGKSGSGGAKADSGKAKADSKVEPKAAAKSEPAAGARDQHGRFVSGEGGSQAAPGKAEKAPTKAESGEHEEKAAQPPPKPRVRQVDGREPGDPHAEVTDAHLADDAELDRRFTALKRESRQARDRHVEATALMHRLEQERATFRAEREATEKAPGKLDKTELAQLAESDPFALLERLGVEPERFHRAMMSSGTERARVERLERQWKSEREAAERRQRETDEARQRQEREHSERQRTQAAETDWDGIRQVLSTDETRPALRAVSEKNFRLVRTELAAAYRDAEEALAERWQVPLAKVNESLRPEQRHKIFERCLDRLEEHFGELGIGRGHEPGPARGGPTTVSGAGPRSAGQAPPEGTQTLTPRLASESSARPTYIVKTDHQLRLEAQRAFERALGGRGALPTSHQLAAPALPGAPPNAGTSWRSQTLPHTKHSSRPCFRTTRSSAWSIAIARCSLSWRRTKTSSGRT